MIHKLVFTITALLLSLPMLGQQRDTTAVEEFDWEPVMEAIIWHESKGNPRARCGIYVGVMQIAPILVRALQRGEVEGDVQGHHVQV